MLGPFAILPPRFVSKLGGLKSLSGWSWVGYSRGVSRLRTWVAYAFVFMTGATGLGLLTTLRSMALINLAAAR